MQIFQQQAQSKCFLKLKVSSNSKLRRNKSKLFKPPCCFGGFIHFGVKFLQIFSVYFFSKVPSAQQNTFYTLVVFLGCGPPPLPVPNGFVTAGNNPLYMEGQVVIYQCLQGSVLVGSANNTCLSNGAWSEAPPLCDTAGNVGNILILYTLKQFGVSSLGQVLVTCKLIKGDFKIRKMDFINQQTLLTKKNKKLSLNLFG